MTRGRRPRIRPPMWGDHVGTRRWHERAGHRAGTNTGIGLDKDKGGFQGTRHQLREGGKGGADG